MNQESVPHQSSRTREHLGIMFECCNVYSRIYKNRKGTAYVGWCPRCARVVVIPIDPSGTTCRFFRVV